MSSTSLGTIWKVSASQPTTFDDNITTGYPSLTYTEVGDVTDMGGDLGATFEKIEATILKTGAKVREKGVADYGELTPVMLNNPADAGQILLKSGVDGANKNLKYSHEVTLQDGTKYYFSSDIYSFRLNVGDASTFVNRTTELALSGTLVEVPAP